MDNLKENNLSSTENESNNSNSIKNTNSVDNIKVLKKYIEGKEFLFIINIELNNFYLKTSDIKLIIKENKSHILIFITFFKQTNENPFRVNIVFEIIIDQEEYPIKPPYIKCLTNVILIYIK